MKTNYWIKVLLLILVVVIGLVSTAQAAEPKNIIFFIGDGMGPDHVKAAGMYVYGYDYEVTDWFPFELFPNTGELTTYSANKGGTNEGYTDSAAAATALATGFKVNNRVISKPDGDDVDYPPNVTELETLLEYFKSRDKSTGLVTTTFMTHATPAAFGAHEADRDYFLSIGDDYLEDSKPNILFGGSGEPSVSEITIDDAEEAGYTVVTDEADMDSLNTETETMVFGHFDGGATNDYHMPYDDGLGDLPQLSEMTNTALKILDNDSDGFFLMVEGGRIDHASHDDLFEEMVKEVAQFSIAVQVAINWVNDETNGSSWDDTLIIVTADHETGPPTGLVNQGAETMPLYSSFGGGHTDENVLVYAKGVNADRISGEMNNTDMFGVAACFPYDDPNYSEWLLVGKPASWCNPRQCHGDADGLQYAGKWVFGPDLDVLIAGWNQDYSGDPAVDTWIAADFDHLPYAGKRVFGEDLNILIYYWNLDVVPDDCLDVP